MNNEKWISVIKGAGIAAAGAGLTYLTESMASVDFGSSGPIVAGLLAVMVNFVRKWKFSGEQ